jgi:uncharacterized BrkB/YihY/UPF0761 family membrane protein
MEMIGSKQTNTGTIEADINQRAEEYQRIQDIARKVQHQHEYMHRSAWKGSVFGTLNVLLALLAARLTLLVGVGGGVYLSYLALTNPVPMVWVIPAVYSVLVVVPLVWLAAQGEGRP